MNRSGGKRSDHALYFTNNEFQKAQISTLFHTGLIIPRSRCCFVITRKTVLNVINLSLLYVDPI